MKQRARYYSKHLNTSKFKKKKTRKKVSTGSEKFSRENKTIQEPGRGEYGSFRCSPSLPGGGTAPPWAPGPERVVAEGQSSPPALGPAPRSSPPAPYRLAADAPQSPPLPPLAATCVPGRAAEAARQRPPPITPAGLMRARPASRRKAAALTWQPRPRRSRYARPGPPAPRSRGRKHKGGRAVPAPGAGGGGSASLTRLSRQRLRRGAPGALPPPPLEVPLHPRGGREGAPGLPGWRRGRGVAAAHPSIPPSLTHSPHGAHSSLGPPGLGSDFTPPPVPAADVAPAAARPAGARRPRPSARRGPSAAGGRRRSRPLPAPGVPGPAGPRLLLRRRPCPPSEGPRPPPRASAGPARPPWTPRARGHLLAPQLGIEVEEDAG